MITLFDYLPSRNAWKVRQILHHLQRPYRNEIVSIFEGEGQNPDFLAINPAGAVPAIRLDDGRVLAESNAILAFLAEDTPYLPADRFARAKVALVRRQLRRACDRNAAALGHDRQGRAAAGRARRIATRGVDEGARDS